MAFSEVFKSGISQFNYSETQLICTYFCSFIYIYIEGLDIMTEPDNILFDTSVSPTA